MKHLTSPAARFATHASRLGLSALVLSAIFLSGCIVNTQARSGILEVRWEATSCNADGIATVDITVRRNGIAEGTSGPLNCTKGFHSFSVSPGTYDVTVLAFSSAGDQVASAEITSLRVNASSTTTTQILTLGQPVSRAGGDVTLSWTVNGLAPSVGCAKHGIDTVTISILDSKRAVINAHATVPCNSGQVTIANVPSGPSYIQLDGTTKEKVTHFGNLKLHGPINVAAGAKVVIPDPLDIEDLRASIAVEWQFSNNNTCSGNNINNVLIELRDGNNKVVVPMGAADANKPCEIDSSTPKSARVIDMMFETPTCTVPANAKGLVICGITGTNIGIHVSAQDATTGQIVFGGSMAVQEIAAGTHTNLPTRIALAPCGGNNVCATP